MRSIWRTFTSIRFPYLQKEKCQTVTQLVIRHVFLEILYYLLSRYIGSLQLNTFSFFWSRQSSKKLTAHCSLYFVDLGTALPIFIWISTSDTCLEKRLSAMSPHSFLVISDKSGFGTIPPILYYWSNYLGFVMRSTTWWSDKYFSVRISWLYCLMTVWRAVIFSSATTANNIDPESH